MTPEDVIDLFDAAIHAADLDPDGYAAGETALAAILEAEALGWSYDNATTPDGTPIALWACSGAKATPAEALTAYRDAFVREFAG